MLSGDYAGLIFRNNSGNGTYYLFRVDPTGRYYLRLYDSANTAGQDLRQGNISPINFNQMYRLAVVANYANIGLYIDGQQIASISDPTLTHGQIGVLVGNESNSAEAFFNNAKVWKL
jgi:hypothetical protein